MEVQNLPIKQSFRWNEPIPDIVSRSKLYIENLRGRIGQRKYVDLLGIEIRLDTNNFIRTVYRFCDCWDLQVFNILNIKLLLC